MDRDGARGRRRPPACGDEPECEIEVLAVAQHALVESPDLVPRLASVGTGPRTRPGQHGSCRRCVGDRMAVKPREARESRICCQTDAVDRSFRDLEEKRGDGSEPRVRREWLNQSLKEIRSRKDVVVEEHEYVPVATPAARLHAAGKPRLVPSSTRRTSGNDRRTCATVSSDEPLSTTMTECETVCARRWSRHRLVKSHPLKVGTTTSSVRVMR